VDTRQAQLTQWLEKSLRKSNFHLTPASSDASFRRYFRVHFPEVTLIAMDAPPNQEDCRPFVQIANYLLQIGLHVPQVIAEDLSLGFLVLGDLGDDTYLSKLNNDSAPQLYLDATNALIKMQLAPPPTDLPRYDEALLLREMQLFPDWYVSKHLNTTLNEKQHAALKNTFAVLNKNILAQGKVTVHRDYHSRNLMVTPLDNPGILDFQDAVYGPITYDLVSLLKDAYITWDEAQVIDWAVRYWQPARKAGLPVSTDFSEFYRDFEWMGAQRHIKVLGIFARLAYRDGKTAYLNNMPAVMHYLRTVCHRYMELHPLLRVLNELEHIKPQEGYTF
jgi:aminoglycoside/choline kinase family phosphotransferase